MVEIIKKKFDQDLFLNLWCNPLGYFAKMNSTLGSVVPLAMFTILHGEGEVDIKFITILHRGG